MFDTLLDRLLRKGQATSYAGPFLESARCVAWSRGHAEVDVEHALVSLVGVIDVKRILEPRGVAVADVMAILEQLLDERPTSEELGPKPAIAARLRTVSERAVRGDRVELQPFLENLAAAAPRELAFFRPALTASAPEIARFFAAPLSRTPEGHLTLEAWSPDMRAVVGLMQRTADTTAKGWGIGKYHLFRAALSNAKHHEAWKARGVDTLGILNAAVASLNAKYADRRKYFEPPPDFVPSITPGLYAAFIRAESYAAEDKTSVMLRHVLAALHDEPDFAPFVEQLLG